MKKPITRKQHEAYLNEIGESLPETSLIIGGKLRKGKYGSLIRKYDPIAFEVSFQEANY